MNSASTDIVRKAGPLQAVLLLLAAVMSPMTLALLAPVLPQLKVQFGSEPGSDWLIPMVITMPSLCLVLCSPLIGFLTDKIGHRRSLLFLALIAYAIVGTAPLYLNGLHAILISRILVGITEAGVLTLSTMLIGDYFRGEERDHWLGFQATVATISAIFLFAAGGALGTFGWRGPFALYATSLLILVGIWLSTRKIAFVKEEHVGHRGAVAPKAFPWKHVALVCSITLIGAIMFFTLQLNASLALVHLQVHSPARIGLLTALGAIGAPLGAVVFRWTSKASVHYRLLLAFAIIAVGFLCMAAAGSYRLLTIDMFITQLGFGILLPSLLTWTVRGLPLIFRGRGLGTWQGVYQIGQFASPIVIGLLNRRTGGLLPSLQLLGIAAAAMALAAGFLALNWPRTPSYSPPH